jgi:hypothetical protein
MGEGNGRPGVIPEAKAPILDRDRCSALQHALSPMLCTGGDWYGMIDRSLSLSKADMQQIRLRQAQAAIPYVRL